MAAPGRHPPVPKRLFEADFDAAKAHRDSGGGASRRGVRPGTAVTPVSSEPPPRERHGNSRRRCCARASSNDLLHFSGVVPGAARRLGETGRRRRLFRAEISFTVPGRLETTKEDGRRVRAPAFALKHSQSVITTLPPAPLLFSIRACPSLIWSKRNTLAGFAL
jgi:hypothetical protein